MFNKVKKINTGFELANNDVQTIVSRFNDLNSNQNWGQDYTNFINEITNKNHNVSLMFSELAERGASARASVEGVYAAILDGNTKGFANVKSTITMFNQAQQSGSENAKAFASAVGQSNTQLGNYLGGLNGARASLVGYGTQLAITTAKTIGLRAASMALNAALSWGISAVVSVFVSWLDKAIVTEKELAEQAKESADKVNDQITALENLKKKYEDICDSTDDEKTKNEQLNGIKQELIETYGVEKEHLENLNLEREKGLDLLDAEFNKLNRNARNKYLEENKKSIAKANMVMSESFSGNNVYTLTNYEGKIADSVLNLFDNNQDDNGTLRLSYHFDDVVDSLEKANSIYSELLELKSKRELSKDETALLDKIKGDVDYYQKLYDKYYEIYSTSATHKAQNLVENYLATDNGNIENVGKDTFKAWANGLLEQATNPEEKRKLQEHIEEIFPDYAEYFKNLDLAKSMFGVSGNINNGFEAGKKKFLEELSDEDLKIAVNNIPDLFADGLDGASKKIQEFKADPNNSIAPSFDYSTYSEQVDTVVKNLDKVQSAIDKLNEGKGIDGKDITELANAFPEYSSEILSASDNTEKLKAVLKDIKSDAPSSLIDTLTNLKDLSEKDQEAVNGLITILSRLTNESATYADTLSDLDTKESLMSTAYKEMHDDGQISISTYQKLISLGDDYADLISIVDGKLIVNAKSIRDLTDAKYADEIATLKLAKAELEYSIAGNVGNADSYIERINAINEEIKAKEKARDLLSGFDYTTTAKKDKDEKPARVLAFEEELAKREHEINMGLREEDDAYYDWLLSAAHTAYDGLKDYQDELWKHEETVYKWRKDKEQELFDKKIENMKTLADKALDSNTVFGDLTRFEYARNQITSAISEIQKRINDIQEGRLAGNVDDIKTLNDELTDLRETLADINKDELEYELDNEKAYWEDLKSKQEDIYDKEIDKLEKVKDAISKKNEEEEKATDLAEKRLALEKAKLELEKARQNRSVMLVTKQGTFYTADQSAIDEAEKNVKDAEKDIADAKKDDVTDKISEQIDVLKEQKENTQNYYDTIIKLLEDSQNDPLQAEANRDLWGKILATENGQNAIASADQDQVNKLIENGFLAFNDGKYSLNNPNAEVPKDSQTITKSDITDVLTTLFGKKEGYTPEKIASIAEKFEEKTHLLYDGFTPSDVVNKATENISKTINNSQVINKVQNMNTTYHIDKIEVGYSGNDFEGLLADTLDSISQQIIIDGNKALHGR